MLPEVAGGALAFNLASRDPDAIAAEIRTLLSDPVRHSALVASCAVESKRFTLQRFDTLAVAILDAAQRA